MRRDLDIDCDPAALVLNPPDRAELKRSSAVRVRNLLNRVDELDAACRRLRSRSRPRIPGRGELDLRGSLALRSTAIASVATGDEVCSAPSTRRAVARAELLVHDAKTLGVDARGTLLAPTDPCRARTTRRPGGRVRVELGRAGTDEETSRSCAARRLLAALSGRCSSGSRSAT